MVIFRVGLEVLGQVVDSLAEERDLNFGGAGVCGVGLVLPMMSVLRSLVNATSKPPRTAQTSAARSPRRTRPPLLTG